MKKIFACFLCAAVLCAAAGCSNENLTEYYVYTNIPLSELTIEAQNYKIEKIIPAQNSFSGGKAENTQNFKSKQSLFKDVMNTDANLVVSDDFSNDGVLARYNEFSNEVAVTLSEIEDSISAYKEGSFAKKFNDAAAGETITVDKIFYDVLSLAKDMYDFTDGYYNPAVYHSVQAYGFNGEHLKSESELPADELIAKFQDLSTAFADIELNENNGVYTVKKPQKTVDTYSLAIDLGGVGKGYATDIVNAMFEKYGFSYGYFNFGNSSIAFRKFYGRGDYTLGLTEPRRNFVNYVTMNVHNVCMSSSGDYENYYILNGKRYCHIIDPTTGKPAETGIMTASVIGGSAAENDALTTALTAMGKDRALSFTESKLKDRYVIFTYDKQVENVAQNA